MQIVSSQLGRAIFYLQVSEAPVFFTLSQRDRRQAAVLLLFTARAHPLAYSELLLASWLTERCRP